MYIANEEKEIIKVNNLDGEIWNPVHGYEEYYAVSNFGRIKSLTGKRPSKTHRNGYLFKNKETLIKNQIRNDYYSFTASVCGKLKNMKIHRYIAMAFIPNPENKPCINHIDGNKLNNSLDNLEWCTRSENTNHSLYVLGKNIGEKSGTAKITKDTAIKIKELYKNRVALDLSLKGIAKQCGTTDKNVWIIGNNLSWKDVV